MIDLTFEVKDAPRMAATDDMFENRFDNDRIFGIAWHNIKEPLWLFIDEQIKKYTQYEFDDQFRCDEKE